MTPNEALELWLAVARLADTAKLALHSQPSAVTLRAVDEAVTNATAKAQALAGFIGAGGVLPKAAGLYATDGKCHNAEPGTFGHECGKPATWLGTTPGGFMSGYCDRCKENGTEARRVGLWMPHPSAAPRQGETTWVKVTTIDGKPAPPIWVGIPARERRKLPTKDDAT
jgi:hypothetical protein